MCMAITPKVINRLLHTPGKESVGKIAATPGKVKNKPEKHYLIISFRLTTLGFIVTLKINKLWIPVFAGMTVESEFSHSLYIG